MTGTFSEEAVAALVPQSRHPNRWDGIQRPYTQEQLKPLRPRVVDRIAVSTAGAERLWELMQREEPVRALGAMDGLAATQQVKAGLKAIYVSGWQTAANNNAAGDMYPDQSIYPSNSVPDVVFAINLALTRADQVQAIDPKGENREYLGTPIFADAEACFGGTANAYVLVQQMIQAGVACVHIEDQLGSAKKCGHLGGKVLVPTSEMITRLITARMAADALGCPVMICARTDAEDATLLTSDIDDYDKEFVDYEHEDGRQTHEGYFHVQKGLKAAIARGLAYAPYADVVWCETKHPDLNEAREFADAIHAEHPGKLLAYNCSPSFNWRKKFKTDEELASFQNELGKMGYKFQFITLASFHAYAEAMYSLSRGYRKDGMLGFSRLQEREFALVEDGFTAVLHQREVGNGVFDLIQDIATGGKTSTKALVGSTEQTGQFDEAIASSGPVLEVEAATADEIPDGTFDDNHAGTDPTLAGPATDAPPAQ